MIHEYDKHVFEITPLTYFFYVLCKKQQGWLQNGLYREGDEESSKESLERHIPDTVVWENNIPKGWFTYDPNEKQIVRRKMETQVVYSVMTYGAKNESDVVAIICGKSSSQKDESLFFEYLTRQSLKVILFESKCAKGTLILQKFMKPFNELHVDALQATWSPNITCVNRRQNIYSYKDTTLPSLTRCATFEGPPHLSRQMCVSPQLESRVKALCENFVHHFHVTDRKCVITRMVMYFVLTADQLYFMYTPCIRVSYVNRVEHVRTALELRALFDTTGASLRRLLSTDGEKESTNKGNRVARSEMNDTNTTDSSDYPRTMVRRTSAWPMTASGLKRIKAKKALDNRMDSLSLAPSHDDIWKTTSLPIFPEHRGGMTPSPEGSLAGSTAGSPARSTRAATPGPVGSPVGGKRNLAALLSEYKESRREGRHMKSKAARGLRAMRHQIEATMVDAQACKDVRMQLLQLKDTEKTLNDAQKMEFLHLALERNAVGRASVHAMANAHRIQAMEMSIRTQQATLPVDESSRSLEEYLSEFEYEVASHFLQYPMIKGREVGAPFVYKFDPAVPVDTVRVIASSMNLEMDDERTVEVPRRKHISQEMRSAISKAIKKSGNSASSTT